LVHPNIVMAFDANEADGLHFLVMEYVHGATLDALVKQVGPLPVEYVCALMRQAAQGLQHAHEKGMVHRDIKPANLLLPCPEGEQPADVLVKLVDFGLARLQGKTKSDTIALRGEAGVLGTPDYIAPEQSRDIHSADIRSDLYSLGCTFYFALAGRVPFPGANAMEKLIKHLMEQPEPLEKVRPDVPPAVVAIVRRLMAKEPGDRYQTPAELVQELEQWSTERPPVVPATPTACHPLWITPPTQIATSEPPAHTRVLDHIEVFAPSQPPVEVSGPSLLEPLWKYAPGDTGQPETHDTLSLSHAEDTEAVTFEATALEKPRSAAGVDSEDTVHEGSAPASDAASAAQSINLVLCRLWGRWTSLVETIVVGRGPSRVNGEEYRTIHALLLQACREAIESAATPQRRGFYQGLLSITQPWLNLQTFIHTEPKMLDALWKHCRQIEHELNDGKVPWTIRRFIGLVLLVLAPAGLAVWYWNSGRLWLPSLLRSFQWDSSSPALRSAWSYLQTHPSLLIAVLFPLIIAFSLYLLSRNSRA
jgi:serine/threonine protein kinase